ncbi:MAG: helix-hairpin-helix domain-containing protein [Desulfobacterota bacterium]|jgi:Fanconi anemia group M protein|nr:helix-hairpin-helix domain-containing protein [Thermodesulfobacteriota bacterium]
MKIQADHRERDHDLLSLLREIDPEMEIAALPYGDYLINGEITVERKTAGDFLISIMDGRLFRQLSRLKKHCRRPLLLIEGDPYATDLSFDPRAIRGALLSTQVIWYIPVLFSKSREETRDIFLTIGRQEESGASLLTVRGNYRPKRLQSKQLCLLQGLPHVGPKLARRLLDHFGSVIGVLNGTVDDLLMVEGLGRVSAQAIREILDEGFD